MAEVIGRNKVRTFHHSVQAVAFFWSKIILNKKYIKKTSLTSLSVAGFGRMQLGVPQWATSVDYGK